MFSVVSRQKSSQVLWSKMVFKIRPLPLGAPSFFFVCLCLCLPFLSFPFLSFPFPLSFLPFPSFRLASFLSVFLSFSLGRHVIYADGDKSVVKAHFPLKGEPGFPPSLAACGHVLALEEALLGDKGGVGTLGPRMP